MRRVLDGYLMEKPERSVCLMMKSLPYNNLQLKAVLDAEEEIPMTTDTSEKGLETLIVQHMTDTKGLDVQPHQAVEYQALHGAVSTHETREAAERLPDEGPIDRNDDDVHVELES